MNISATGQSAISTQFKTQNSGNADPATKAVSSQAEAAGERENDGDSDDQTSKINSSGATSSFSIVA